MPPNCSGFKEGKVKISAGSRKLHSDVWVKYRETVLFTSNTKLENKVAVKNYVKQWNHHGHKPIVLHVIKNKSSLIFFSILLVNLLG